MSASRTKASETRPNDARCPALRGRQRYYARQKQLQRLLEQQMPWPMLRPLIRFGTSNPWTKHHRKRGCIFIHIPKNAGNSVSQVIYDKPFLGHDPLSHFFAFDAESAAQSFKFAFSRNPWDRLVSAYQYLKSPERSGIDRAFAELHLAESLDFRDFVHALEDRPELLAWHHFRPQNEFIKVDGKISVDYVGSVECIAKDFDKVAQRLGIDRRLPRLNASRRTDYRQYYDDTAAERVARIYQEDVNIFDYSFT